MTANIFPSCSIPCSVARLGFLFSRFIGCFGSQEAAETQNERACPEGPVRAQEAYGGAGLDCQDDSARKLKSVI